MWNYTTHTIVKGIWMHLIDINLNFITIRFDRNFHYTIRKEENKIFEKLYDMPTVEEKAVTWKEADSKIFVSNYYAVLPLRT